MSFLDDVSSRYRVVLCDIWGVVHDGVTLYPGAADRLRQWREQGCGVVLITNAPRTADEVMAQLERIGLPHDAYDFVVTGGEAGIVALAALDRPVGFIGTETDRAVLEGRGVRIANGMPFTDLAVTGVTEDCPDPADYVADLEGWAAAGVRLHCLNPDRIVVRGGVPEACAGAIADLYQGFSGEVVWYGKPYPAVYEHALRAAGDPPRDAVLVIGDGLPTDMLGAARQGLDAVFVTGGINAGEPFPSDFGSRHGLGDWRPVAIVHSLA